MKYCIPYNEITSKNPLVNKADEWNINYNPEDKTLIEFIKKNNMKRINLHIFDKLNLLEETDFQFLNTLCETYNNLYIAISIVSKDIINKIIESKIKYYFSNIFVNDWDFLYEVIDQKPTDIFITERLGFELDKVAQIVHSKGIKIRVFPNVAQSSSQKTPDILKFFIRPEDIQFYENYIDVCEFFGNKKQIEYLHIYKDNQEWYGPLKEIINSFNSDLDSRFITPRFAQMRISCEKKCIKGGLCRNCYRVEELSHTLEDAGLVIQIDKK